MPRIAAWIITHPHSDHIGVIDEFSRMYGDQVELERVICNFVSDDVLKTADAKAMLEVGGSVRNLRNRLNTGCWSDTAIIKPHTGQLLEIDDAKIRIWSTHEDVYPDTEALAYMNAASLTFTVTLGDTDFLVLGDATNKVTAAMAKRYGSLWPVISCADAPRHDRRQSRSVSAMRSKDLPLADDKQAVG